MTVELVLTEEIIDCFHSCAKKPDYRELFSDHPEFFEVLVENLEKLEFPSSIFGERSICQAITKNTKHLLNILRQWHSSEPTFCQELIDMEKEYPEFIELFRKCGSVKDWNDFYVRYQWAADYIIWLAEVDEIFDFKIECAGLIFDSFKQRDRFLKHGQKLKNELSQIRKELKLSETKQVEDGKKLRSDLMNCVSSQAKKIENQLIKTDEILSLTMKELELSEKKREEKGQNLRNKLVSQITEELEQSRAKLEEDGQKLRIELMDRFECQAQQMENRISETNEKIESMNRKLAHFNSSFNEKFNSLEEKLSSLQLDKKIEAMSMKNSSGEDLNQFLTKIGDKFNEQQMEMKLRAEWIDRKMEKMMEMMKQQGEKSSGDEK